MYELSTMCSPRKIADPEGTKGTPSPAQSPSFSRVRLCPFSKHTPIRLRCAVCSYILSLALSSSSLEYLKQQQRQHNEPFARNEIPRSEYPGASFHCSSAASLALRAKWRAAFGVSPLVTASTELRSRPLTRRSRTTMGAAGMFEDVGVCYARPAVAT
jgi:hypothetical protein